MSPRDALTYAVASVGLVCLIGALLAASAFLWLLWGLAALVTGGSL